MKPKSTMNRQCLNGTRSDGICLYLYYTGSYLSHWAKVIQECVSALPGSCKSREIAALKPSTVLLLTALSVSVFQSFTVLWKKECLYISVVAESTLICLLLDVLDGRWLYWYRVVSPQLPVRPGKWVDSPHLITII